MTDRHDRPAKTAAPSRPRLFARERTADSALLWRVGAWAGIATLALVAAIVVARSPVAARHGALAEANAIITAQARQLQQAARQTEIETRRLAAALDTLNADRDRLYARVTDLERNLDTVTGSVTRLAARPAPAAATPPPAVAAPQSLPVALKPAPIPPEPFPPPQDYVVLVEAPKPEVTASIAPKPVAVQPAPDKPAPDKPATDKPASDKPSVAPPAASAAAKLPLGLDLGNASSIEGLRAIWDSTRKAHPAAVEGLHPVVTVVEPKNGLGLQLRLVAGPLPDAASVTRRCAALIEATRPCASAVYDGQRLGPRQAAAPSAQPKPARTAKAPSRKERSLLPGLFSGRP